MSPPPSRSKSNKSLPCASCTLHMLLKASFLPLSGGSHLHWSTTSSIVKHTLYLVAQVIELKFKSDHHFTSLCIYCYLISLQKLFSNCSDISSDKCFIYLQRFLFTNFLTLVYWGSEINFVEKEFSVAYKTWETLNMTYADLSILVLFCWLLSYQQHQTA